MGFNVYPDEAGNVQTQPLTINAGAKATKDIGSRPATGSTFIRIALLDTGTAPTFALIAGAGSETQPGTFPNVNSVFTAGATDAGDARTYPVVGGVYLIEIFMNAAATWQLVINNNAVTPQNFTWVV